MVIKKYIITLFILIFTFSLVSAIDYQADIIFDISETGLVEISGNSNHPLLQNHISQNYTSKKGEFWIINFSIDETFSEYIFELKFPQNTNINYIKIPNILNIDNSDNRIIITSTAQSAELKFLAQYSYSKTNEDNYSLVFLINELLELSHTTSLGKGMETFFSLAILIIFLASITISASTNDFPIE